MLNVLAAALVLASVPDFSNVSDAPVDEPTTNSRLLTGTVYLQDGEHEIYVLKVDEGDTLPEVPFPARLVPLESWVLMGQERVETFTMLEKLQGKPEWWMLFVGMGLAAATGVVVTGLLLQ